MAHIDYSTLRRFEDLLVSLVAGQKTIIALLNSVLKKEGDIVALVDDLKAGIAALDTETTAIGVRIDALLAQLANSSISDADKADVLASLAAEAARLKVLATDPNNPVPPPTPQLAAARKKKP